RIAGYARERGGGGSAPAELRRGRLAQDHRARLAQPGDDRRVVLPGPGRIDREGTLERGPAAGVDQVLDGDGDAIERPHGLVPAPALRGSGGLAHGALRIHEAERLDDRIDRLDPAQDGGGPLR